MLKSGSQDYHTPSMPIYFITEYQLASTPWGKVCVCHTPESPVSIYTSTVTEQGQHFDLKCDLYHAVVQNVWTHFNTIGS